MTVNSLNVFVFIIKSGLRIISIYFELQRYSVSNYFPAFSTTNEKACHQVAEGAKDLIKTFRANLFDVLALEKKGHSKYDTKVLRFDNFGLSGLI